MGTRELMLMTGELTNQSRDKYMVVSWFPESWGYLHIIHYKASIFVGYPHLWNPPDESWKKIGVLAGSS